MKNLLILVCLFFQANLFAQITTEVPQPFQKQRLFTGGDLSLGFSSITTNIGVSPQFGLSLTNWADVGVAINFNYTAQRDQFTPEKIHLTTIGPGVFARLFPIDFLFASVQFEYNFIKYKFIPGNSIENQVAHFSAPSLLLGIGYAGGRVKGGNTYYYFSVSGDFLNNKNSPYIDRFERMIPVVRAGYNIGLFQGGGNNYRYSVNF